jgi:hypothetical protein
VGNEQGNASNAAAVPLFQQPSWFICFDGHTSRCGSSEPSAACCAGTAFLDAEGQPGTPLPRPMAVTFATDYEKRADDQRVTSVFVLESNVARESLFLSIVYFAQGAANSEPSSQPT